MASRDDAAGNAPGSRTLPGILMVILAVFGFRQFAENGQARAPTTTAQGRSPEARAADTGPPAPEVNVEDPHVYDFTTNQKLRVLDPLWHFYKPRLDAMPKEKLPKNQEDLVRWLLEPKTYANPESDADELHFLIACVPDPARSGSPFRYDQTISALMLALRRANYVLDNFAIDWKPKPAKSTGPAGRSTSSGEQSAMDSRPTAMTTPPRLPGLVLLRRTVDPSIPQTSLLALLLVAETPVRGVNTMMLERSLDVVLEHARISHDGNLSAATGPVIRVVGPCFSGSTSSIVRAVTTWRDKAANRDSFRDLQKRLKDVRQPLIRWIDSEAVAIPRQAIESPINQSAEGTIEFLSVAHDSTTIRAELFKYLLDSCSNTITHLSGENTVAFLTEETTRYGNTVSFLPKKNQAQPGQQAQQAQNNKPPFSAVYKYTFAAHISEVRREYQLRTDNSSGERVALKSAEHLDFAEDEGSDTPEMIRVESPRMTALSDEQRLLRVACDINERGIRFAWIAASDLRDALFVARILHEQCPNIQLLASGLDHRYVHHEKISVTRGMFCASTYPLWLGNQDKDWTVWDGTEFGGQDNELPLLALPADGSYASYNATLAHLNELDRKLKTGADGKPHVGSDRYPLIGYGWPGDPRATAPPVWISVASMDGFLPLQVRKPVESGDYRLWSAKKSPNAESEKVGSRNAELFGHRFWHPLSGVTPLFPFGIALALLLLFPFLRWWRQRKLCNEEEMIDLPERQAQDPPSWGTIRECASDLRTACETCSPRWPWKWTWFRRPTLLPFGWAWLRIAPIILTSILGAVWLFGLFGPFGPFGNALLIPLLVMIGLSLITVAVNRWLGPRTRASWTWLDTLKLLLGVFLAAFLLLVVSAFEPYEGVTWLLRVSLVALFLAVLWESARLDRTWDAFERTTSSLLLLPLGPTLDRMPSRLANRFSAFTETLVGNEGNKETDNLRIAHLRDHLRTRLEKLRELTDIALEDDHHPASYPKRLLRWLMKDVWPTRSLHESYADTQGKPAEERTEGDANPRRKFEQEAEEYVALELVWRFNRYLQVVWIRVFALTILTLLLICAVDSYPFQPAGRLLLWTLIVAALAVFSVLRVLVGINRNEMLAHVNNTPLNRSLFNIDFLTKISTYVAPILALIAAVSYSTSGLLRVFFTPFLH